MSSPTHHPRKPSSGPLHQLWDVPVSRLVSLPIPVLSPEERERHSLYSLLVLSLVIANWNGNKKGPNGTYPFRPKQKNANGVGYVGGDYLGHNIGCIAVDGYGHVIDFAFNHNYVFDSTVEHAESRLVRRIFGLVHLHDGWMVRDLNTPLPSKGKATFLSDVTIYTSLEPCSQCAGMMALGNVKEVIFLQRDPGQFSIGNILRNLGELAQTPQNPFLPPRPIPADVFGFEYFKLLNEGYEKFSDQVGPNTPFYISPDEASKDVNTPITSYLCTDEVFDLMATARKTLKDMGAVQFPDYKPVKPIPPPPPSSNPIPPPAGGPLTNADVLTHVRRFLEYTDALGRRGTPHRV